MHKPCHSPYKNPGSLSRKWTSGVVINSPSKISCDDLVYPLSPLNCVCSVSAWFLPAYCWEVRWKAYLASRNNTQRGIFQGPLGPFPYSPPPPRRETQTEQTPIDEFWRLFQTVHCKKRLAIFPSPTRMSLTTLFQAGNNLIIPGPWTVWSVISRLGTGKPLTFFYSVSSTSLLRTRIGRLADQCML
jgi:hypothetical protein